MKRVFYYVARKEHQPGDLLGAGHFGAGYRTYPYDVSGPQGACNGWKIAKEMIFESVREQNYGLLPSRLRCSYAYVNKWDALTNFVSGQGLFAHEVVIVDELAPRHVGDFSLLSSTNAVPTNSPFIPWAEATAHAYWVGQNLKIPELLTLSPIKVLKRIA